MKYFSNKNGGKKHVSDSVPLNCVYIKNIQLAYTSDDVKLFLEAARRTEDVDQWKQPGIGIIIRYCIYYWISYNFVRAFISICVDLCTILYS